jgi:oligoendopeptidase, pepF/M3 family
MAGSNPEGAAIPRWDLAPIYPSLASSEFAAAKAKVAALAEELIAHLSLAPAAIGAARTEGLGDWLFRALELEEAAGSLFETLSAYAYASFSTATGESEAIAQISAIEELGLPLRRTEVLFRNAIAARRIEVEALLSGSGDAGDEAATGDARISSLAFHIREELFWQSRQMSPELEDLAADLSRSGGSAWSRLQESITSTARAAWPEGAPAHPSSADAEAPLSLTLVELRNLAYDADRTVRGKAYRLELEICESLRIPAAAALNGVKGFAVALNARRGWNGAIEKAIEQARITRAALDSLIGAIEESLPSWRRYLGAKARALGLGKCAFFDLFAPVGGEAVSFSFPEARDYIVEKFSSFDSAMGDFASRAFSSRWIDAEPRAGKVGGAYCIDFPEAKAARILCNFDGSFNSVTTIAHELGHAWHAECVRGLPYVYTQYPMTLAETASIFSETLVFESALKTGSENRRTAAQRAALLELHLQDGCQVIVDILSRFYFERAVFERRSKAELSPEELCELMLDAQRRTYGDGLDSEKLHPYMWLVKGHYYSPELAFYNFPYAFGQLFGAGLYARYEKEGAAFAATYRGILEDTGRASAVDVTAKAGFDIEKPDFWREGLAVFARQVEVFEESSQSLRP